MTESGPLVSVIIPTKNSERSISACLASINVQTYRLVEAIVVDQGSRDSTLMLAQRQGARVVEEAPSHLYEPPTRSRNAGARAADGSILLHIDSDMQLSPDLVSEIVGLLTPTEESSLGALVIHEVDEVGGYWSKCKAFERSCYWGEERIESARVVKREVFEEVGGYDESLKSGEDFDIHRRYKRECRIGFCREVVKHDLRRLTLMVTVRKKYHYGKSARSYLKKYEGSGPSIAFVEASCLAKNYKRFLRHPVIGCGSLLLKICEGIALCFGLMVARLRA